MNLEKPPFRLIISCRQSSAGAASGQSLVVELEPNNSPDVEYYLADKADGRMTFQTMNLTRIDHPSFAGEEVPIPLKLSLYRHILLGNDRMPISLHQTLAGMDENLTKFRSLKLKLATVQDRGDVSVFDIGSTESFPQAHIYDDKGQTGIVIFRAQEMTLMLGKRHHLSKSTDWPCEEVTAMIQKQFCHAVPTTEKKSAYRYYLHLEGVPHSLHQNVDTVAAAIEQESRLGRALTLRNARGQEITL